VPLFPSVAEDVQNFLKTSITNFGTIFRYLILR
jgi:hypothetical protein